MPTKTDRILSYLPQTFKTSPRPAVLYPVVDAFGNELLLGENCLAAIMLSHWVDFADKNASEINDLEKMAALYGLAPWRDESGESLESVEEFREHLKRYVRTFLEGTVTVQGILRVTAEALALRIAADKPDDLNRWWARDQDSIVTFETLGNDAAALLNFDHSSATGSPALSAEVTGSVDLSQGISLQDTNILRLKIDGGFEEIDLTKGITPTDTLTLPQVVDVINKKRPNLASHDGRHLKLSSPITGPTSKLEVINGPDDASPRLLGLAPKSYHGAAATAGQFKGTTQLDKPIDLSNERYLRIEIDGKFLQEIDCADDDAAQTTLEHIRDAINNAFPGLSVASDDGKRLILTSPTKGIGSSISVQPPAAQNAAERILGVASLFAAGLAAQPARAESTRDLRGTVDLSERMNIRLRIDGADPVTINCAGVQPDKTERVEIVAEINKALNAPVAIITDQSISVVSPSAGPASEIVFEQPASADATFDIFGIGPLNFQGSASTVAHLVGSPSHSDHGLDVRANNFLVLAVDGGTPLEIDLRRAARNHAESMSLPLDRLAEYINKSFGGAPIASTDGEKLFLTSTRKGGVSKLEILPRETLRKRRFVTRAIVIDEAARDVFGFFEKESQGKSPVRARLVGKPDLSQSVDLTKTRFLRLQVDGFSPIEIDCGGVRPRATMPAQVVLNINTTLKTLGLAEDVAREDGKHLILVSPSSGEGSRLVIAPPQVALDRLMGVEPGTFRGAVPTAVKFTSTVNLSGGIDLPPGAAIKLAIDDAVPSEITLGGSGVVHRSPFDIANEINKAFTAPVASTDGRRVSLTSAKTGTNSKIKFLTPSTQDVTKEIFGIAPPREYHGAEATAARVEGQRDLSGTKDLSVFRFLRLAIDAAPAETIDCAAEAANPKAATLAEIVKSIGPDIASSSADGKHLILSSRNTGPTAKIELEPFSDGDASRALFGDSPLESSGSPAGPAVIIGEKSLLSSINLSRRSLLRIAVDGRRSVDIDVAGAVPAKTALDEIVAQVNRVIPGLAAANADDKLQLTSPSTGPDSSLSLQAFRFLELIEYPLRDAPLLTLETKHGGFWPVVNDGVADSDTEIRITATHGTVGPALVNSASGWSIRLVEVLERGDTARLYRDARFGLRAEVIDTLGHIRPIAGSKILVGPLGAQAWVPFQEVWGLTGSGSQQRSLQLNNPKVRHIVLVKSLQSQDEITVDILESDISSVPAPPPAADGEQARLVGRVKTGAQSFQLVDASGTPIAELLPGPHLDLKSYLDEVVKVQGPLHHGTPGLMLVEQITNLFDVMFTRAANGGAEQSEKFMGVSIGAGTGDDDCLVRQVNGGSKLVAASKLVRTEELDKASILNVPPGKTLFRYLDCLGSRFDYANFDCDRFAGVCLSAHPQHPPCPCCEERGVFDVSRFNNSPPEKICAVFASSKPFPEPPVTIEFRWTQFSAGAFLVNLPADLPPRFGGRFDEARFGQDQEAPELFEGAVAEPLTDDNFLVKLIMNPKPGKKGSDFVKATRVDSVELGWTPAHMPIRKPQFLTLGGPGRAARLYLEEDGLNGFIRLDAKEEGAWGNEIAVSARQAGPAIYDVSVFYRGGRFEQARSIVMGAVKETISELFKPGPTGVLQAKAAGVRADVIRERADNNQLTITT